MKIALITGITGQDGSYLSELLLEKGYLVHGIIRRSSSNNLSRIKHLIDQNKIILHYGELEDMSSLCNIISNCKPDEIYNLGCQSHVKVSFETPLYTTDVAGLGFLRLLESIKILKMENKIKVYQASSSEMYGTNNDDLKNENSSFLPSSPYGVAKLFSHHISSIYRDGYQMFICSGILFNHESPRRNEYFVTRKISKGVARIHLKKQEKLELGNLDAVRDWGHAKDYVKAMYLMLQQDFPDDYVIATSKCISVREFVEICFGEIGIEISWHGVGMNEVGKDQQGLIRVSVKVQYFREKEVPHLKGDYSKAERLLNWKPEYDVKMLAKEMVESDIDAEKSKIKLGY